MLEWMLMPYRKLYAAIAGRSSRREFWMFVLLNVLIFFGFIILISIFAGSLAALNPRNMQAILFGTGFSFIALLFIPLYIWGLMTAAAGHAVAIRRFHDLNLSGWLYALLLIAMLIPLLNIIAAIGFLVLMCISGTRGPNRYGQDPTDTSGSEVFA